MSVKSRLWLALPLVLLAAPAWSWCDHDKDDPKFCHRHAVPEPGSLALYALGSSLVFIVNRRRPRK